MPTSDDYARAVIGEGLRRNITDRGIVIALATVLVESGDPIRMWANHKVPESLLLPHDSVGSDGYSCGLFQQQVRQGPQGRWWWGDVATCMDPTLSAGLFYDRLAKRDYNHGDPGEHAQAIQKSAFPHRYSQRMGSAQKLYDRLVGTTGGEPVGDKNIGDPVWLEDVLRPALGDRLKTLDGWRDSGHGDYKDIRGVMVHHTGNSKESAQSIRNGRPDLQGPLSNLHIAPDGTVTIVALGVCWHAGAGSYPWLPTDMANWHMIGIECAWPDVRPNGAYNAAQRWPDKQIISMRDTCAALIAKLGYTVDRVIGHKEYAGAAQGKWDPGHLDMGWFRGEVKKDLDGFVFPGEGGTTAPQPGPILPPDYAKEAYDQLRIQWRQLGDQTLVNAIAEIRDKVCGVTDYADWKAAK